MDGGDGCFGGFTAFKGVVVGFGAGEWRRFGLLAKVAPGSFAAGTESGGVGVVDGGEEGVEGEDWDGLIGAEGGG